MKKILVILLFLPVFLFSQEKKKYEKTISFSQFAKELKEAADKGVGYTLENHYITYDPIRDKKHITYKNTWFVFTKKKEFVGDMQIKGLAFNKSTKVKIINCRFGEAGENWSTTITFKECSFDTLEFYFNDVNQIFVEKSNISDLKFINIALNEEDNVKEIIESRYNQSRQRGYAGLKINNSEINKIYCSGTYFNETVGEEYFSNFNLDSSKVASLNCKGFNTIRISDNTMGICKIKPIILVWGKETKKFSASYASIRNNVFKGDLFKNEVDQINIFLKSKSVQATREISAPGLIIRNGIKSLQISNNTFLHAEKIPQDTILQSLLSYQQKGGKINVSLQTSYVDNKLHQFLKNDYINISSHEDTLEIGDGIYYHDSISFKQKLKFLKEFTKKHKIQLNVNNTGIEISDGDFNDLQIKNNNTPFLFIKDINITEEFEVINTVVDSVTLFNNNTLPEFNNIIIDSSFTNRIGFYHSKKISYGVSIPKDLDSTNTAVYNKNIKNLITTYRQIISILSLKGDDLKTTVVVRLKDIETNKKGFIYHQNPNIENWFNWQGAIFLKWYSDYGMNPFKALAYCFWVMLYFSMFYFIFYNEWDKIDRSFLMKRFNSAMDYFTTEKRIEDFYASKHNKEMSTFTDFKATLNKNKIYMPTMLAALARPIYQISLLRYKLLNFSYKRAEFMAGRRWIDLDKKEKYWIGSLTFLLTLTYIIYLIFIRVLNSVVLSINAFSTLGFGQIPVRGFTKYVAIIEGFVGWFLLSIFLVSVLSQMISI